MLKNVLNELVSIYSTKLSCVKSNFPNEDLTMLRHLKLITEELEKLNEDLEIMEIQPETKTAVNYLSQLSSENTAKEYKSIVNNLKKIADNLFWRHGYQNPSEEMIKKYAYTEIIGPEGPIYSEEIIVGFVLLAPDFYYPKHRHTQIEETYLFLTSATFYNKQAILAEGSFILNEAGRVHELKSAGEKPTLILYSWIKKGEGSLKDYQLNLD